MRLRLLAALALSTTLLVGCGDEDGGDSGAAADGGVACDYPAAAQGAAKEVDPPPGNAALSGEVAAEMTTDRGRISLTLLADAAPCTVNSFASLAEQDYYDDTVCHRLTVSPSSIFVLQCGDPTGTGTGGPGYSFPDELSGEETYPAGTVAMANAGEDTNGSQFFLVYDDTPLPPSYAVFGRIDEESIELVRSIAAEGTATGGPDGAPAQEVRIETISIAD